MATPVHVPRINNNDDEVKLAGVSVSPGEHVKRGQVLGQVETEKSVVDIEAPDDGFVLAFLAAIDATIAVGSILLWLGKTADEEVPSGSDAASPPPTRRSGSGGRATAGALLLLRQRDVDPNSVPCAGDRLTVADVQRHLSVLPPKRPLLVTPDIEPVPEVEGRLRELRGDERSMLATVKWHRDIAAAGYIELEYDSEPWNDYAKACADRNKLLLSPLLALMARRLVGICRQAPALNATLVGDRRLEYSVVNLGFTIQAGETLYLAVMRDAAALDEAEFVNTLGDIQRRAMTHKLGAMETQGATVGFSSMARWKVSRHIPLLAPCTSLMVAHASSTAGRAVLGASYDHRVLNGFHVANALRQLSVPPAAHEAKAPSNES
jgi:pyruvate dehydrogenase E2 component (dihydrolipoamide acetyltransferase)